MRHWETPTPSSLESTKLRAAELRRVLDEQQGKVCGQFYASALRLLSACVCCIVTECAAPWKGGRAPFDRSAADS